jgi:hypothetical protein
LIKRRGLQRLTGFVRPVTFAGQVFPEIKSVLSDMHIMFVSRCYTRDALDSLERLHPQIQTWKCEVDDGFAILPLSASAIAFLFDNVARSSVFTTRRHAADARIGVEKRAVKEQIQGLLLREQALEAVGAGFEKLAAARGLARGVPVGSELAFVDLGTIAHALVDRRDA